MLAIVLVSFQNGIYFTKIEIVTLEDICEIFLKPAKKRGFMFIVKRINTFIVLRTSKTNDANK